MNERCDKCGHEIDPVNADGDSIAVMKQTADPPMPSQELLDLEGVELTGECREPIKGEMYVCWNTVDVCRCSGIGPDPDYDRRRWIVVDRPAKPAPQSWGRAEWERAGMVRDRETCCSYAVEFVAYDEVKMYRHELMTFAKAADHFTQLDGRPCEKEA